MSTPENAMANTTTNASTSFSAPKKKTFRSRISILLTLFFLGVFIPVSLPVFQSKTYIGMFLVGLFVLIVLLFTGIRYTISDGKIFVHIWSIPYGSVNIADIRSVRRSYNPLSSPAASLKRLRLDFRRGAKHPYILISPIREREFIDALKTINPRIKVDIPQKRATWRRPQDWDI